MHGLRGQIQAGLLIQSRTLEQCAHFIGRCEVITLGKTQVLICFLTGFLDGCCVFSENRLRAAEVLFQLTELFHNLLAQLDGCCGCCRSNGSHCHANALQHTTQGTELIARLFGFFARFLQFVTEVIGLLAGFIQLALHVVERRLCVIQLNLPCLCAPIVLTEGFCCIGHCLSQGFYLFALGFHLFA